MEQSVGVRLSPSAPNEFSELIANLLVSCIQGLTKSLPAKDKLSKKLKDLEGVVRKGVRISPATGWLKRLRNFLTGRQPNINFWKRKKVL